MFLIRIHYNADPDPSQALFGSKSDTGGTVEQGKYSTRFYINVSQMLKRISINSRTTTNCPSSVVTSGTSFNSAFFYLASVSSIWIRNTEIRDFFLTQAKHSTHDVIKKVLSASIRYGKLDLYATDLSGQSPCHRSCTWRPPPPCACWSEPSGSAGHRRSYCSLSRCRPGWYGPSHA